MLARLIAFKPVSHLPNLDLVDFVRVTLDRLGIFYRLSHSPDGSKANIHAIIGPVQPGGLAFSGHVDVVPEGDLPWTGDPWTLRRQNGRLIGRGASDMMGFVACMLAAAPAIKAMRPSRPIHLLFTYDEEVGYSGVHRLVADMAESGLRPDFCVVGEPSGMVPVIGQKGRFITCVDVRGKEAHSSRAHRGVNAVHAAARAIAWLADRADWLASDGPSEAGYEPPYTTLVVNHLRSGNLPNCVPDHVSFEAEWRSIPGHDPAQDLAAWLEYVRTRIEPGMAPAAGFDTSVRLNFPVVSIPDHHPMAAAAVEATGLAATKVSYCSEGAVLQPAGIACMVCGPGVMTQVHRPDESVEEAKMALCDQFIERMAARFAHAA